MSASASFTNPTQGVHELWYIAFTYFKVIGWGLYYLCSVLDDYSRYIIAWKLFTTMAASDVKEVLDLAIEKTGVMGVAVKHEGRGRQILDRREIIKRTTLQMRLRRWRGSVR